jgi:hypothetical protein
LRRAKSRAEKRNLSAEGRSEAQRAQRQIQVVGQFELQATEITENPVLQEYPIPKFAANYFREADLSGLMAL